VNPFFRDELLVPVLHFVSLDRGEIHLFQILAIQWSWTLMSIRMNHPFHGGKSLPARQEDSKLQIMSR